MQRKEFHRDSKSILENKVAMGKTDFQRIIIPPEAPTDGR
jgi:hypothetical protein